MEVWVSTLINVFGITVGVLLGCWLFGSEPSLDALPLAIAIMALHGITCLKLKEQDDD